VRDAHPLAFPAARRQGRTVFPGVHRLPHLGPKQILETYYRPPLGTWRFTAVYQFVVNPTYDRGRGPVSIIGTRLRTQF
jgi:high affinity Mn2+ porin